ncbi:aminopeptidase N-like [Brienomyrus brachyistius]|uniref:aminopeptidase N-like n=1 Tax=Brienomyrus brachyistius TaxID=42636 RepID=UPI0020B42EDE|nr:aminopeptidase N-like [Brienomyrus brachyistius]
MGKGFYISKAVGVVAIILGAAAVATIIALSVVYAEEKSKNEVKPTEGKPEPRPTTTESTTAAPSNEPWDKYRLPDSLIPEYYNITLWPRLQPNKDGIFIFTGNSFVVFKCLKETNLILIHSNKLNYTKYNGHHATLTGIDNLNPPTIDTTWLKLETQFLVIQLNGNLIPGKSYRLDTEFVGELADDLGGFYRSEYYEDDVKKVVATTQMQAADARKAFPCFDEPAMKAVFHITLIHDIGTVALSNGMETGTKDKVINEASLLLTTFEPTKRMSTYLLAFIVSDFTNIAQEGNVLIRIWARRKAIADGHGEYALNITGTILQFFETYYNAPYPLSKSDQIALPDFNAGAMENWGLITYRETGLLYDPLVSSNGNKEKIAAIISHELAHMWFGNLVTLKWWNDLWLNEGFASYVEYLGADHAEPLWNIKDLIVPGDMYRVFAIDALASSHPLSSREDEINKPEQISELFDAISYSKGASVLRMLSEFLTEEVFSKGLSTYLNHFAYNNTVYTDLWDHLQTAVETSEVVLPNTVRDIMDRWVLQMGFPVVTINTTTGTVSQKHFLLDPDSVVTRPSEFNYQWYVPIKWTKTGIEQPDTWLLKKEENKPEMSINENDWLLANLNVTGYYRVNYDNNNWERLLAKLMQNHAEIPVINRGQILDDSFNLARAKIVNTTLALRTTKYLYRERDYIPWQVAINNLDYFILMFDRTEVYGPLQAYLGKQIGPLWDHFTQITDNWTMVPEKHMDQYNEVNAIKIACSTGFKDCKDLVKDWYTQWMQNPNYNPIHPNLRSTVYCRAIAEGGVEEWNFGWKMFQNASIASEAEKLRAALACTTFPWLLNRYLEYTLDPSKIRKQDATSTIIYIANNVVGQPLAWDFVRANWNYIFSQYGGGSFSFSDLINGVTKRFSTEFELGQLEQFKKDNAGTGLGSGTLAVDQSIERTKANMKWVAENRDSVLQWFTAESV